MPVAHQTFQLRGYCRARGYERLRAALALCSELYNAALQERRDAWRLAGERRSLYDQERAFTAVRAELPEWAALDVTVGRGVLRRLDRAFSSFFRRVRDGERPGYPRFRSRRRYRTIELSQVRPGMVRTTSGGRRALIRVKGLPVVEVRLRRALPPSEQLRSLRFVLRAGRLFVDLVYAVEREPLPPSERAVGVDLGVHQRLALSDGTLVEGRTPDRRRERRLRRAVSRSRRGSRRRARRVATLAREADRNSVRERNACHRVTTALVRVYGRIAVEDLRVPNMTRSARGTREEPGRGVAAKRALNRRILEQSWGRILGQISYKAEWAGRDLVRVDPAYTSRSCSGCGASTPQRRYRVYDCPRCGLVLDRDVNAARNILARAYPVRDGAGDSPRGAQSAQADALEIVA